MRKLTTFHISKKRVREAGDFILTHGRDIEKALYLYHFGKETTANVISVLERYINPDGGIGGLEPDILYRGSMPINCAVFFSILHSLKIKDDFKAVNDALAYLQSNMNENKSWASTVPEINSEPRAVWWNWNENENNKFNYNPTCELIGDFYHFGGGDYRSFSKEMLDTLCENLSAQPMGTLEMHELISLMQLCRMLPDIIAEPFIKLLGPHIHVKLVTDKTKWNDYVFSPLTLFRSPLDPLYHEFEKEITNNLDYDIMSQTEDGYWLPNWHWWQFNEDFEKQKNIITANYTLNKLIIFKNFNRITSSG